MKNVINIPCITRDNFFLLGVLNVSSCELNYGMVFGSYLEENTKGEYITIDFQSPCYFGLLSTLKLTRKYLLRGYILGVLMHTTAWDNSGEIMVH